LVTKAVGANVETGKISEDVGVIDPPAGGVGLGPDLIGVGVKVGACVGAADKPEHTWIVFAALRRLPPIGLSVFIISPLSIKHDRNCSADKFGAAERSKAATPVT